MTIRLKDTAFGTKIKMGTSYRKNSFLEDLLAAKPKDYAERNYLYYLVSNLAQLSPPGHIHCGRVLSYCMIQCVWAK